MQFTPNNGQGAPNTLRPPTFWGRYKKYILIALPIILIIAGGVTWFVLGTSQPGDETVTINKKEPKEEAKPVVSPSLVNGVMVATDIANRHPVAVMIENSQAARPQVGLTAADVVYEAVAEGGITRFMAIYSQDYPAKAGPVRSARSYFIDWLSEYDAFYAHAGGSPTALARIGEYGIKDYPHNADSYYREAQAGVASEHTLFADISKIYKFGLEKKKWPATFDTKSWLFKDPATPASATGPITINFSSAPFKVVWKHDVASNEYARELSGSPHKDRLSGEQLKAKTIIVMIVQRASNPPYQGTGKESEWSMTTIGSGEASVFQDGVQVKGTWKKPSRTERTRFYNEAGQEITLTRGKIWVEVVPQTGSYSVAPAAAPAT